MNVPENLKYTKDHEWIRIEGEEAVIGITEFASKELGDVVYVEVETIDDDLSVGDAFGSIEAVKTVSDMFMPMSGTVLVVNPMLENNPEIINKDPYGDGWIIRIALTDLDDVSHLITPDQYAELIS